MGECEAGIADIAKAIGVDHLGNVLPESTDGAFVMRLSWEQQRGLVSLAPATCRHKVCRAMNSAGSQLPTEIARGSRSLTSAEFHWLADVPTEIEWFANITNPHTRRAYENAVRDFMQFAGIGQLEGFRAVTRAHVIAWRDDLARRGLGGSTVRHRLASLASLFEYLCERNAVTHNSVKGVERPRTRRRQDVGAR